MGLESEFIVSAKPSRESPNFRNRSAAGAEYRDDNGVSAWYVGTLEHEMIMRPSQVRFLSSEESGTRLPETRVDYYPGEAHILSRPKR